MKGSAVLAWVYLFCCGLLEGKLHGGHGQLVGEEVHIPGQLQRADVGSWAISTADATQQLSLSERRKDEGERKEKRNTVGMSKFHWWKGNKEGDGLAEQ